MEQREIVELSALVERLGWRRRVSTGVHVVDLLLSRTATDLIAALAENRDQEPRG
jgi:primosomal replication protein N